MIKLPGFFFWFGITEMIVCATLMVILFLFFLPQEGAWGCIGILGFLFVTGLVLVVIQKNCLIVYRERELIYRNFFRITIRFDCREIKCAYYKNGGGILLVFKNGRKFGFGKEDSFFLSATDKKESMSPASLKGKKNQTLRWDIHRFLQLFCGLCVRYHCRHWWRREIWMPS